MLSLESHIQELSEDAARLADLKKGSAVLHKLSNGAEMIETIQQLMCRISINQFGLKAPHDEFSGPLGFVFDPASALLNHSCDPNVAIRHDVSHHYSRDTSPSPTIGSISIHARKPIATGEELFTSYIDPTATKHCRQMVLQHNYQFKCTCTRCETLENGTTSFAYKAAERFGELILNPNIPAFDSALANLTRWLPHSRTTSLEGMKLACTALSKAGCPFDQHPFTGLRLGLLYYEDGQVQISLSQASAPSDQAWMLEDLIIGYFALTYESHIPGELPGHQLRWRLLSLLKLLASLLDHTKKISPNLAAAITFFVLHDFATQVLTPEQLRMKSTDKDPREHISQDQNLVHEANLRGNSQGLIEMLVLETFDDMLTLLPVPDYACMTELVTKAQPDLTKWRHDFTRPWLAAERGEFEIDVDDTRSANDDNIYGHSEATRTKSQGQRELNETTDHEDILQYLDPVTLSELERLGKIAVSEKVEGLDVSA